LTPLGKCRTLLFVQQNFYGLGGRVITLVVHSYGHCLNLDLDLNLSRMSEIESSVTLAASSSQFLRILGTLWCTIYMRL